MDEYKVFPEFRFHHPKEKDEKGQPKHIEGGRTFYKIRRYYEGPHITTFRSGKNVEEIVMKDHNGNPCGFYDDVPGQIFESKEEAEKNLTHFLEG